MKLREIFSSFFKKHFYNPKWQCSVCGAENFGDGYVCEACEKTLPYIKGAVCSHCGRTVIAPEEYCSTCKEYMTSVDKARSVFNYEKPISGLIHKFKYGNHQYLKEFFGEDLTNLYLKNYFNADYLTFIPMHPKDQAKRGYNQSKLLTEVVSNKTGVAVFDGVSKIKRTKRQAKLNRAERLKNLVDAYRVTDKKSVKDKAIVIIDDVSTTGATAQALANKLKKAGAKSVCLITVASVPPKEKY